MKRNVKQIARRIATFGLAAIMLAGCGNSAASGSNGGAESGDGATELTFMDVCPSAAREEYFTSVFESFEKETGIHVTYESVPWDNAVDKLTVMGTSDELPDVMTLFSSWMGQFTSAGWAIPIDDYIAETRDEYNEYVQNVIFATEEEKFGALYTVPDGINTKGVYVRKDWAEEAGIDFGEDIAAGLSRLQMKATEYRLASRACEQAKTKKAEFEKEHNMEELSSIERCPYTLDELNMMIQDVDERMEEVRVGIEQYSHQIEDLQEQLDIRDEKEQQLDICRREQEQEGHHYEVLALTQSFLQTAKEQFSARYLGPIENGFGKYYELLTGDHSGDWMVDANIAVQMKEQGEMRETKWLSAGYQDLLGICMRLALVDAMYPDEKPFLVLDDPFVNLDEEKVVHGNEPLFERI